MRYAKCETCTRAVVPILFLGNFGLALFKTIIGFLGNSAGLIADGMHSATDAVSSAVLYVGIKFSDKPADDNHPYGHRKIEFIIAKVVSIFLLLVGGSIFFSAVYAIMTADFVTPDYITLVTALLSIVANIVMNRYGICVGTQLNSPAVLSVSYEMKADAMTSVAIAVGIVGALLGFPYLDPIAACIVSLFIVKNSVVMLMGALDGLMDASIDEKMKRKIQNLLQRHPDVLGIEFLRTRQNGRDISVEAGIRIQAEMTLDEGDAIVRELRGDLLNLIENVGEIEISISSADIEEYDEAEIDGDNLFGAEPA